MLAASRPVSPSAHQPVSPSARQPISPSARQPVSPSARQPVRSSACQPTGPEPVSPSARQPVSPSARQPVSLSARQPVSLSAYSPQPVSPSARQPTGPPQPLTSFIFSTRPGGEGRPNVGAGGHAGGGSKEPLIVRVTSVHTETRRQQQRRQLRLHQKTMVMLTAPTASFSLARALATDRHWKVTMLDARRARRHSTKIEKLE